MTSINTQNQAVAANVHPYVLNDVPETIKDFLERLAGEVVQACKDTDMSGEIEWSTVNLNPRLICVQIQYKEDGADTSVYKMFVLKRYHGCNMIRLERDGSEPVILQADAQLILAVVSF